MRSVVEWYDLRGRAEWQAVMTSDPLERAQAAAVANLMVWLFGHGAEDPLDMKPGTLDEELQRGWDARLIQNGRGPNT